MLRRRSLRAGFPSFLFQLEFMSAYSTTWILLNRISRQHDRIAARLTSTEQT